MCKQYIREKELKKWTNKLRLYYVLHPQSGPPHNACSRCPNCSPGPDDKRWGKYMMMINQKTGKIEVVRGEDWIRSSCGYHCVEWIMWF